ncbi:MAG: hypothetical protein OEY28_06190, partial [Nitrospira sp.]|nr:hypothetical protein [Nitrospira sp.]
MSVIMRLLVIILSLNASACVSNLEAKRVPGADLTPLNTFYVQKLPADTRGVDQLIADRLTLMGFRASTGVTETPTMTVDAIVTYQDKWMWDITMYMIQLDVQIRDPQTRLLMATGQAMRSSMIRKSPEGMVEEVLTEIFRRGQP